MVLTAVHRHGLLTAWPPGPDFFQGLISLGRGLCGPIAFAVLIPDKAETSVFRRNLGKIPFYQSKHTTLFSLLLPLYGWQGCALTTRRNYRIHAAVYVSNASESCNLLLVQRWRDALQAPSNKAGDSEGKRQATEFI